jgi:hypothetical protein
MPGIVNEDDLSALAAEYVIGTLDPDERERANALLDINEDFRALVRAWERRLGELHLMVEPVEPDGRVWERISGRLGVRAPAPPPFAPQVAAAPTMAPFSAPPSAPISAPPSSSFSTPIVPPASEPSFESGPEFPRYELEPLLEPPPSSPPSVPPRGQRTTEQELASLIEEADKFTTQLSELASRPPTHETDQDSAQAASSAEAASHAESLLAEAADAIATKPVEPHEVEHVEEPWPEEPAAIQDQPPPIRGPLRDSTMLLSPADVARLTVRRQQVRIGRWRAAALVMAFLVLGLGSLIAAWRFAPDHLPQQLQPIAVLGLGEWSPSERVPAEHGTQFEE